MRSFFSFSLTSVLTYFVLGLVISDTVKSEPVAIVEDVSVEVTALQFMDIVEEGQIITLEDGQSITLGFLNSCTRESITGGIVTVGYEESQVSGGSVERELVDCDGGDLQLSKGQKQSAGVIVFRKAPTKKTKVRRPQRILYGVSPLIKLLDDQASKGVTMTLNRLDGIEERYVINVTDGVVDLLRENIRLDPGGLYVAAVGDHDVVFKISPLATNEGSSVLSRLLAF